LKKLGQYAKNALPPCRNPSDLRLATARSNCLMEGLFYFISIISKERSP
jgi:hypothetical protein